MSRILPFSLIVLTAISMVLCIITVVLAFLNLDLIWSNIIAAAMTASYHLLVLILAWHKLYSTERSRSRPKSNTNISPPIEVFKGQGLKPPLQKLNTNLDLVDRTNSNPGIDDHNHIHKDIPYPTTLITLGIIILSTWIITFGTTTDMAAKGFESSLAPSMVDLKSSGKVPKIDFTELVASSLVNAVEMVVMILFLWCCLKGKEKYDEEKREKLEDRWFYPITPVLQNISRASLKSVRRLTVKSFQPPTTRKSITLSSDKPLPTGLWDSAGAAHVQTNGVSQPRYPFLLSPPEPAATARRKISPWEYMTPANPTPAPSSVASGTSAASESTVTPKHFFTPLRRPLSNARVM